MCSSVWVGAGAVPRATDLEGRNERDGLMRLMGRCVHLQALEGVELRLSLEDLDTLTENKVACL